MEYEEIKEVCLDCLEKNGNPIPTEKGIEKMVSSVSQIYESRSLHHIPYDADTIAKAYVIALIDQKKS